MNKFRVIPQRIDQPVMTSEVDIAKFVQADCAAEGFTVDVQRRKLHALRFREGVAYTIKTYDLDEMRDPL